MKRKTWFYLVLCALIAIMPMMAYADQPEENMLDNFIPEVEEPAAEEESAFDDESWLDEESAFDDESGFNGDPAFDDESEPEEESGFNKEPVSKKSSASIIEKILNPELLVYSKISGSNACETGDTLTLTALARLGERGEFFKVNKKAKWTVNGEEISGTPTALSYTFDAAGEYTFRVKAIQMKNNPAVNIPSENQFAFTVTVSDPAPESHSITYHITGNGSVTVSADTAVAGTVITVTATPDTGWSFDGWNSADVTVTDGKFTMPDYNVTLCPKFVQNQYDVTVKVEGKGTASADKETAHYGDTVSLTANAAKGWKFAGYTGISVSEDGTFTMPASDVVVTAHFVRLYSITLYPALHGKAASDLSSAAAGETVQLTVTSDEDWKLTGWLCDPLNLKIGADGAFTMPAQNVSIRPVFTYQPERKEWTVTFDGNGQTISTPSLTGVKNGSKIARPEDPAVTGYLFKGWYKDAACTTPWNFKSDKVWENTTLFACWEPIFHTVTFYDGDVKLGEKQVLDGSQVPMPTMPDKLGYSFKGWIWKGLPWSFENPVYYDLDLCIKWEPLFFTVTFWNGEEKVSEIQVQEGECASEPAETLSKPGFVLDGWTNDGQLWAFDTPVMSNLNLTAKWALVNLDVIMTAAPSYAGDALAATVPSKHDADTQVATHIGETVYIRANAYAGYHFVCWKVLSNNVTLDNPYAFETSFTMGASDALIEAIFAPNACHIHNWSRWNIVREPTAAKPGLLRRVCKTCGEIEEKIVPAKGDVPKTADTRAATQTALVCLGCALMTLSGVFYAMSRRLRKAARR